MIELRKIKIHLSIEENSKSYNAGVWTHTKAEAIKKAVLAYLLSLILLVMSILIPIVHFIAVPGLFILGPIIAFLVFKAYAGEEEIILEGKILCLNCHEELDLKSGLKDWPLRDQCEACGKTYEAKII